MQTATHSVLSTASSVPPKQASSSQTTQAQGGGFADDFHRAQHALNTSSLEERDANDKPARANSSTPQEAELTKTESTDVAQTAKTASASRDQADAEKASVKPPVSPVADAQEGSAKPTNSAVIDAKAAPKSGNPLQSEGEESPAGIKLAVGTSPVVTRQSDGELSANSVTDGETVQSPTKVAGEQIASEKTVSAQQSVGGADAFVTAEQVAVDHNTAQKADALSASSAETKDSSETRQSIAGNQKTNTNNSDDRPVAIQAVASQAVSAPKGELNQPSGTDITSEDSLTSSQQHNVAGEKSQAITDGISGRAGESATEGKTASTGESMNAATSRVANSVPTDNQVNPQNIEVASNSGPQGLTAMTSAQKNATAEAHHPLDDGAVQAKPITSASVITGEPVEPTSIEGGPPEEAVTNKQQSEALSAEEAERLSKIPPEVLALQREQQSSKASAVDLSALSQVGRQSATSSDNKLLKAHTEKEADKMAAQLEPQDETQSTDLSWVLSQMATNPVTQASNAAVAVASGAGNNASAVGVKGATNKVADQVALANAVHGAGNKASEAASILASVNTNSTDVTDPLDAGNLDKAALDKNLTDKSTLLSNEPIELRKKEQDALISKMMGQFDASKEADTGGMGSSLSTQGNSRATPAGFGATAQNNMNAPSNNPNVQQNLAMSVPPNHPGWPGEMSQKVAWLAQGGAHSAHIKLDPPELGSLTVKVSVDNDNNSTQVSFVAATPHARDLLEGQMGRLKDMLAQQGMDLGNVDVDVSQQDTSGMQYQQNDQGEVGIGAGLLVGQDEADEEAMENNISYVSPAGIDYYA